MKMVKNNGKKSKKLPKIEIKKNEIRIVILPFSPNQIIADMDLS